MNFTEELKENASYQQEPQGVIEYLKNSALPLVLYGTAHLADCVKFVLDWHNIKIDIVAVDKEYWQPNTSYRGFDVQPLEDILANAESGGRPSPERRLNIIMAFIGKNNDEKIERLKNLPNVQECIFFEPADLTSYLRIGEFAKIEDADFLRILMEKIKQSDIIYLKDEETAKAMADNWKGEIKKPENLRFIENAIPVVLCANDGYAPYLAVMLQSLLDHSNPQRIYHFIIFERGFSSDTKKYLSDQATKFENCKIDFVDISSAFDGLPLVPSQSTQSVDIFLRLFIPYWLDKYPKVIYLDSDMIAKADIAQLYDLSIEPFCMGATKDEWFAANFKEKNYACLLTGSPTFIFIENWDSYFAGGILVFDTKKFKERNSYKDLFAFAIYYTNRYSKHLQEQDVLNLLIKDDLFILPPEWNYAWEKWENGKNVYISANSDTKILHFVSRVKPWKNDPEIENCPETLAYRKYAKNIKLFIEKGKQYVRD